MKSRFRCRSSHSDSSRDVLLAEYDNRPDVCLRVAKAFRSKAEAWVYKMKEMSIKASTEWLASHDFHCQGSSKHIRATKVCAALHARSIKGFEADFAKEVQSILQESVMLENIKKYPELEKYILSLIHI